MKSNKIFFLLLLFSSLRLSAHYALHTVYAPNCQNVRVYGNNNTLSIKAIGDSGNLVNVAKNKESLLFFATDHGHRFRDASHFVQIFTAAKRKFLTKATIKESDTVMLLKKKESVDINAATRKWNFKAVMFAVCNYINNGLKAKYRPAVLLAADPN